ncbi:hypothetical protein C5748_08650 [Phyllobacterium phragmitis]|uniref:17 kDa surface antigen n=1 Tax=Phyllobacterium phragmitis TaxID=2670329 RepID=A0A2S9ITU5_9HYPH|nr:hypothetical protein [Phyllobacterium phragmitis]PRD43910.1 hypothetical protein C5748_08650 [Phyllobacterium phragmitis]
MNKRLSMIVVSGLLALSVAGCTTGDQRTAGYGVGGAALGGLAGGALGGTRGALGGAALGGLAGVLIGSAQSRNGVEYCRYREPNGRVYEAPCR